MPTVVEALFEDLRAILLKPDQAAGIFPSAKVAAGRTVAAGSHGRGTGRPFMAEVFAMSRFRPAGFRNRRTAWRRASRPVSGRPARRRSTAFRDGWNRIAAAGPHGTPLRLGTRSRHGRRAPRGRRFTLGGSGKSVARCHRTVLAYWKFESISLQQTVRLSPDFAFVPRKARVLRRCGDVAGQYGRQRRARSSNIALRSGSVSIGRYFSTAASPMRFAPVGAAAPSAGCAARDSAISIKLRAGIGSSKAEQGPLIVP